MTFEEMILDAISKKGEEGATMIDIYNETGIGFDMISQKVEKLIVEGKVRDLFPDKKKKFSRYVQCD
ncbi:hypothetical protein KKC45_04065 [Patescibacteria group bacterium]|nr:hypothetical protein [Patescibacteria group bacterium]